MKIVEIKNGIAKVEWRKNDESAYMEVDETYYKVGDEVRTKWDVVFNGGDKNYEILKNQFEK